MPSNYAALPRWHRRNRAFRNREANKIRPFETNPYPKNGLENR